jgi:integrase
VIESARKAGGWCSNQCADLIELLAYSGCRIDEARNIKWEHLTEDGIWVHGGSEGTKSGKSRFFPFNPALKRLLDDLREHPRYYKGDRGDYVLAVRECQKAINRACTETGVTRFTHHDLRHLFITRCIESAVDIPAIARWVGHRDGGVLIMKTYSHLLEEHSQAVAAKLVS